MLPSDRRGGRGYTAIGMSLWLIAVLVTLGVSALVTLAVLVAWRRSDAEARGVVKRIVRLPFRSKLRLAAAMARDRRIPLAVRGIPPALILYLSMPVDIIPDFIPVLGYLDDVLVVVIGVGLLLRFAPRHLVEEHVSRYEAAAVRPVSAAALPAATEEKE